MSDDVNVALRRARACAAAGETERARALYQGILDIDPEHAEARAEFAVLAEGTVPETWREPPADLGGAAALYRAGRPEEALRLADRIPDRSGDVEILSGACLMALGRLPEAETAFRAATELAPENPFAHANLGGVLNDQGRYDEAAACHERALGLAPEFAEAHNNLGVSLQARGRIPEAIESFRRAVALRPDYADAQFNLGNALHHAGRLDEAERAYRQTLELSPGHDPARRNLAVTTARRSRATEALRDLAIRFKNGDFATIAERSGDLVVLCGDMADFWTLLGGAHAALGNPTEAERAFERALQLSPDRAQVWASVGHLRLRLDRPAEANEAFDRAVELAPDLAVAVAGLAAARHRMGDRSGAAELYERALQLEPGNLGITYSLGQVLWEAGLPAASEPHLREVVLRAPEHLVARTSLGVVLQSLNRTEEALVQFEAVVEMRPDSAEALCNLGALLQKAGQTERALNCLRDALAIKPDHADAHYNLGVVEFSKGDLETAEKSFLRALELRPDHAASHANLGAVKIRRRDLDAAVHHYRRALALDPGLVEAHEGLGRALLESGDAAGAAESMARVAELAPDNPRYAWTDAFMVPPIAMSREEIAATRQAFEESIVKISQRDLSSVENFSQFSTRSFFMSYHGLDNRKILENLSTTIRSTAPAVNFRAPHTENWKIGRRDKIRVGFCSDFLKFHTIGKLYQGYIFNMDRSLFEIILFHGPASTDDALRRELDARAHRTHQLPRRFADQLSVLSAEELDVLFYPDIGMSMDTYMLAHARLAPVQMVSWGHPDTTGISTMDHFLSSERLEDIGAEALYSENLLTPRRLPCFYPVLPTTRRPRPRSAFGLPEGMRLYGCPQTLFKLHPDFDAVLAGIAERDPDGRIVLVNGSEAWKRRLRERWAGLGEHLNERVIFIPNLSLLDFVDMLAHLDVLLDPLHFGSGNTFYESCLHGVPTVTWPQRFMRARIVAGGYAQMQMQMSLSVDSADAYVDLAVRVAMERDLREHLSEEIRSRAREHLFEDSEAVRELQNLLIAASIDADANGPRGALSK